jgi:hypothetical protein
VTEAEWNQSDDPRPMLKALQGTVDDRELRAFAVAACRLVWDLLGDERSRQSVEGAERYLAGQATEADLAQWHAAAKAAFEALVYTEERDYDMEDDFRLQCDAAQAAYDATATTGDIASWSAAMLLDWKREEMAQLLRGMFARPRGI